MKLFRFFASKSFWANLILIFIVLALIAWGTGWMLGKYTRHGENLVVPDLKGLSFAEAEQVAAEKDLKVVILDTAEFVVAAPKGSILEQYPEAGSFVKQGREIKLSINPLKSRKIPMPDIVEKTKRRAIYDLESKGFIVGELRYVPYIGRDVVVDAEVNGAKAGAGKMFEKGTVVDLILGQGLSSTKIPVPYLRFMSLSDARQKLLSASLNLGSVIYDPEVQDTALAVVYRQNPGPSHDPAIKMGMEVDLWLTEDYTKIAVDSLEFLHPEIIDSLQHDSID